MYNITSKESIMGRVLNIVNGDMSVEIMKKAHINGDFLPWRDFLHDGPVPQSFSLSQVSKIRAYFIHEQGFGTLEQLEQEFEERDKILKNYHKYEKIILWFEHDLYDQLQLLQILSWFKENNIENRPISLICTDTYIGESEAEDIPKLLRYEHTITQNHLELAHRAWNIFSEPTPEAWFALLKEDLSLFQFLEEAIKRLLEEYPNTKNGLSRSEHQALLVISKGFENPHEIFEEAQKYEKRKFMGDIIFWKFLDDFIQYGIIKSKNSGQTLQITPLGQQLLNGQRNWVSIKPLHRWIGGVNLMDDNLWCWDIQKRTINKYYYSTAISALLKFKN